MYSYGNDFDDELEIFDVIKDYLESTASKNSGDDYFMSSDIVNKTFVVTDAPPKNPAQDMSIYESEHERVFSEACQNLLPFAAQAVDAWDFKESPIYLPSLESTFIDTMVNSAYNMAKISMPDYVYNDISQGVWGRAELLKAVLQVMILNEIFQRRR